MARMTDSTGGGQASDQQIRVTADGQDTIAVPHPDYIANAEILRDGQDLILRHPDGGELIVEGYFSDYPPPALVSPTGARLTPELVESFVKTAPEAAQYAQAQTASDESPVGTAGETSGTVTVTRTDGTVEPLTAGMPIFEGDIIETDANGAANIQFIDETSFAISSNAKLAIDDYVFDPATNSGESNFSVLRGMFVFVSGLIGRDDPDDVEINTPVGSIGIRGTTIAGNVDTGQITVIEGAIVLRSLDGQTEVTLAAQFETARFNTADGTITTEGTLDASAINTQYSAMQNVAPAFFSGIADAAPADANGSATGSGEAPVQDAAPVPATDDPVTAPLTEEPAPAPADALPPPTGYNETSFEGETATKFEASAETVTTTSVISGNSPSETLLPPPPTGTVIDTTLSGGTATTTTINTGTTTFAPPPPPPIVINGGGTVTAPPPGIFNLNGITAPDGFRLSGGAGEHFGASLAGVGDYNNDGLADFMVGNSTGATGTARIFDVTRTVQATRTINSSTGSDLDGAGDIDGDGTMDYIIGSGAAIGTDGYIEIVRDSSSSTFTNMGTGYRIGSSVAGVGDLNGDGFNDIVAGAPGANSNEGKAIVVFGDDALPTILEFGDVAPANTTPDFVDDGDGTIINGGPTLQLGRDVSAAGDFNNDGYADFIYSTPIDGKVYIATGGAGGLSGSTMIKGISAANTDIPLFSMGDVNGDGVSDIGIADGAADAGRGVFHIMYGSGGGGLSLHVPVGNEIISGGSAGDFNGDGRDDIAVAMRSGDKLDIFVLYGAAGLTGSIALTDALMNDASKGFRMGYSLLGQGLANPLTDAYDIELTSPGDINGDGRDDLLIGAEDANSGAGEVIAVYGRDTGGATLSGPNATAAGQSLVGTTGANAMSDGGFANVSFNGGAGADMFHIAGTGAIGNIDGGAGMDMLRMGATRSVLDFSVLGSEKIAGVERFIMQGNTQTIRLGIDDIFRLMQESQDGILRIDSPNTGNVLSIQDNTAGTGNFTGFGFVGGGTQLENGINYNVHNFEGYSLYIDPTLTVQMV